MAKASERIRAIQLRSDGNSIKSIAKQLEVSPGSVSIWCRDVILNAEQIRALEINYRDPFYGKRLNNVLKQKENTKIKVEKLTLAGIKEIGKLSRRELFLVGVALYWAEGYKKDSQAGLGSSDPKMIILFIKWLKDCFGYDIGDLLLRVTVNEAHENRILEITRHWSELLGINTSEFRKPFYQKVKWKKEYENPNEYYGVLRVRVRKSKDFLRKIIGMIEGLKLNSL